jgi:hypothetical protein
MKKMTFLFAAVLMAAMVSAFTTKQPTTLYYRNSGGLFIEKTGIGNCMPDQYNCEYIWTGAVDSNPQNPSNYLETGDDERVFVPDPIN